MSEQKRSITFVKDHTHAGVFYAKGTTAELPADVADKIEKMQGKKDPASSNKSKTA